jgi:pimeloyl-ACP methyl ester carboxylesterase
MPPPPVLMVHGAFCGGWAFDAFAQPFAAAGHEVIALDLPGHEPGANRSATAGLSMNDYAAAVARAVAASDMPPVLVGHSIGGLVATLAAARAPVSALILLAPSPPWGVTGSTMEEAISSVSLFALGPYWAQAIDPDYGTLSHFAVDRLPGRERHAIFDRMVPESGRALFETLSWWLDPMMTTMARPEAIGAPILALSGERDVIHSPATVRETARRLGAEFEVMPGMSHWLPAEPGWEQVAARCLSWISEQASLPAAAE